MKPPVGDARKRLVDNVWSGFETNPLAFRNVASASTGIGISTVGTYRLYCLDGVDKVSSAEWIEAEDDSAALDAAEGLRDGRKCELWQGSRLVARLELRGAS